MKLPCGSLFAVVLAVALPGCKEKPTPAEPCGCARYSLPAQLGTVGEGALAELSGLAASRAQPGVLYAHNDSGDSARFFALSETGKPLGTFVLRGAGAVDWEDMAIGPCATGTCLFFADVGDNSKVRSGYAVYRVSEPSVSVDAPAGTVEVEYERLSFVYPQGERFNAETLLVHPSTGALYVATKDELGAPSTVFRIPDVADGGVAEAERVAELSVPSASDAPLTAGEIHPCGDRLLLRTYTGLFLVTQPEGAPFEEIFTAPPQGVPFAQEFQGEAVAWRWDGHGYLTAGEWPSAAIWATSCR